MFEEARNNIDRTTRRGLALYFGTVNLAGETVTQPRKILRGIERRGERVLQQIETNNRQIRRSFSLLERRTTETAKSVRGTARATVGLATSLADDARTTTPGPRKRSAGRTATRTSRGTSTRTSATTRQRSQAAEKGARTRALNERKAELKKTRTVAKAKATRAKNETKTGFDKAQANVQHGLQAVGHRLEDVGERIERTVEKVAS